MDFIERIFGISPDAGNGMLDLFLLLVTPSALYWVGTVAHKRLTTRSADKPQS
jgi:hypothetical protein